MPDIEGRYASIIMNIQNEGDLFTVSPFDKGGKGREYVIASRNSDTFTAGSFRRRLEPSGGARLSSIFSRLPIFLRRILLERYLGRTAVREVAEADDVRVSFENGMYDLSQDSDAAPMNDSHFTVAFPMRLVKVFLDETGDLARRKGMQIERVFNRQFYGFFHTCESERTAPAASRTPRD